MSNVDYNKNVLEHFENPCNMGELKDADGVGTVGNPSCGDVMKVMIKVDPKLDSSGHQTGQGIISDVKFQTFGCAAAIASSSMMTVLAKGKSLDEARKITNEDVAKALGELPPIKVHCSNLAADALQKAIGDLGTPPQVPSVEGKGE